VNVLQETENYIYVCLNIQLLSHRKPVECKNLHNEELNDVYSSPNIARVMKSRRMGWMGHVTRKGERRGVCRVWWGNLRERDHLEVPGVDGRIIVR